MDNRKSSSYDSIQASLDSDIINVPFHAINMLISHLLFRKISNFHNRYIFLQDKMKIYRKTRYYLLLENNKVK